MFSVLKKKKLTNEIIYYKSVQGYESGGTIAMIFFFFSKRECSRSRIIRG